MALTETNLSCVWFLFGIFFFSSLIVDVVVAVEYLVSDAEAIYFSSSGCETDFMRQNKMELST